MTDPDPDPDGLPMWTVTTRPADYPATPFVVRRVTVTVGVGGQVDGGVVGQASTLAEARRRIRDLGGSVNLGRHPQDLPVIVETWV